MEKLNKFTFFVFLFLVATLVAILFWQFASRPTSPAKIPTSPQTENFPFRETDTTQAITKDLNGIKLQEVEAEFKNVDAELNSL